MTRKQRPEISPGLIPGILIGLVFLFDIGQIIWHGLPYHIYGPDVRYAIAKTELLLDGFLFQDPVTGLPTFHPVGYHLFLAIFRGLGIPWNALLIAVSLVTVAGTFYFSYRVFCRLFNARVAAFGVLLLPFIHEYASNIQLILPTASMATVPIFLAGLDLYLSPRQDSLRLVMIGLLWSAAFVFSPWLLFLLLLLLVRDIWSHRNARRVLWFAVGSVPAAVLGVSQLRAVMAADMHSSAIFSLFREAPDIVWVVDAFKTLVAPVPNSPIVPMVICIVLLGLTAYRVLRRRRHQGLFGIILAAYVLTHFTFVQQYSIRISFFLWLLAAGTVVEWLDRTVRRTVVWQTVIVLLAFYGVLSVWPSREVRFAADAEHDAEAAEASYLQGILDRELQPFETVLCAKRTYLYHLLARGNVRALGCYRTLAYFQLPENVALIYEHDYNVAMRSASYEAALDVMESYGIRHALFTRDDVAKEVPILPVLNDKWEAVLADERFLLLRRP
jgi:hypothetical protein